MQDFELGAYAKAKLTNYRWETEFARQLPRRSWRSRTAHFLRGLADGLERQPAPFLP